jgi:GTP-binding protein
VEIKQATFVTSSVNTSDCPAPDKHEYAFIGRSNVGKSSLINMLTNNSKLAKISSSPGKTQTINHFLINNSWYLVDLPGYGYAKVSKTQRASWKQMIDNYLMNRKNLECVFVLVDCRIPPQANDLEFMCHLGENQVPFCIVYTKSDKLSESQRIKNIEVIRTKLLEQWETLPPQFISSAKMKWGKDDILNYIAEINRIAII